MDNSSFIYHNLCGDGSLMVIIPHEDDEINLAGALIYGARQEGIPVKCVFLTNGDAEYPAFIRIHEAVKALKILGVKEEDIIFLGYPDGGRHGERSPFLHRPEEIKKAGGHPVTYGSRNHPDFASSKYGKPHDCSWENLLSDLEAVILEYKPSLIAATDFDYHPDHRMCCLAFMEAMNRILHKDHRYRPKVLMGYCYTTSFDSVDDFYGPHLLSTVVNRQTLRNKKYETENPVYPWKNRLRLPVPAACRTRLKDNILFHALCAHLSQKASRRAVQLVNGDEVFWERRTDNLLYEGEVTVSSGNPKYLHDFHMIDTKDILSDEPEMMDYLWTPNGDDKSPWCQCDFRKPQHVESMALYGNIEEESRIEKGRISFSNGFALDIGPLSLHGQPAVVSFPPQEEVQWVRLEIIKSIGEAAGLSEWEIFRNETKSYRFLQITMDDQFAYDWTIYPGEKPKIGVYSPDTGISTRWSVNGQPVSEEELNKKLQHLQKKAVIRVEDSENPSSWCEVTVRPAGLLDSIDHRLTVMQDRFSIWWEKQSEKRPHHRLRKMKKEEDYRV